MSTELQKQIDGRERDLTRALSGLSGPAASELLHAVLEAISNGATGEGFKFRGPIQNAVEARLLGLGLRPMGYQENREKLTAAWLAGVAQ